MRVFGAVFLCWPFVAMAQPAPPVAEIDAVVAEVFAGLGCALPTDLVEVYRAFLLDEVLGLGPERSHDLLAALNGRAPFIDPNAPAILDAARAVDARALAGLDEGGLTMRQGMISAEACEPMGTVFMLAPYDIR